MIEIFLFLQVAYLSGLVDGEGTFDNNFGHLVCHKPLKTVDKLNKLGFTSTI